MTREHEFSWIASVVVCAISYMLNTVPAVGQIFSSAYERLWKIKSHFVLAVACVLLMTLDSAGNAE